MLDFIYNGDGVLGIRFIFLYEITKNNRNNL